MNRFWHRAYTATLDLLFPPLCLKCEVPVQQDQALCADCWKALRFIAPPCCACCGLPFDLPVEEGTLCGACLEKTSNLSALRSALVYDDASRDIILRFKNGDRQHPARALAQWMQRAGAALLAEADVIVPVPLHRWRLLRRTYNQSAMLARALADLSCRPLAPDLLQRVRATEKQKDKNRKERALNVRGAFAFDESYDVRGLKVLLIDDVLTSGATLEECARVLLSAGAARVTALTLARVVSHD